MVPHACTSLKRDDGGFSTLRACHRPRRRRFREVFPKIFWKRWRENFFENQISSLRSILSKNRPNRSYPRDFSDVWSFRDQIFTKLWTAIYPPRMVPFGLKLWENAFQTIPDISFFDGEKKLNFQIEKYDFCNFGKVFEELRTNGSQNQIRRQISL